MTPFQTMYGMNPRGVNEIKNLAKGNLRSVEGEDCVESMQGILNTVKQKLQESNKKYNKREKLTRRNVNLRLVI